VNILVSPLPREVRIGETGVPIRVGYRTGIQIARLADSGLDARIIAAQILVLYFGADIPSDHEAALEAAMSFHRCGEPEPKKRAGSGARALDWDHDAGTILADFRREYGIDLADEHTRMHWWAFMAYFDNLSAESEIKRAMYYRTARRPKGIKGEDAKRFDELKRAYALPARTEAELEAQEAAFWGD
jgi:hypothetical protein